jgi:hypothetical protein
MLTIINNRTKILVSTEVVTINSADKKAKPILETKFIGQTIMRMKIFL